LSPDCLTQNSQEMTSNDRDSTLSERALGEVNDEPENTWDQKKFCIEVGEVTTTKATKHNNGDKNNVVARWTPKKKLLKCFIALSIVFVIYAILLTSGSIDSTFVMIGGIVGSLSSVRSLHIIIRRHCNNCLLDFCYI